MKTLKGRIRVLLESFAYQSRWTFDDLVENHVPSVFFKTKTDLEVELNQAVLNGDLDVDEYGVYTLVDREK